MAPFVTDAASAVELMMLIGCTIAGVSHIVRPGMWVAFFTDLHQRGRNGLVLKIFALEFWPALLIVTLHQVWQGPGVLLTLYGWVQLLKVVMALIVPELGMKSLAMAQRGNGAFVAGGVMLLVIAASACGALVWPRA